MPELQNVTAKNVDTEFGDPSDQLMEGTIDGVPVVVLSRLKSYHKKLYLAIFNFFILDMDKGTNSIQPRSTIEQISEPCTN